MQQGSYMLIERGMTVRGTDGDLGTVADVVADPSVDIFRGIVVSHGLLLSRKFFVAADVVTGVEGRTVQVNVTQAGADALPVTPGAAKL